MKWEDVWEIINELKENINQNIPSANQNEQNYYMRGIIDTLALLPKTSVDKPL